MKEKNIAPLEHITKESVQEWGLRKAFLEEGITWLGTGRNRLEWDFEAAFKKLSLSWAQKEPIRGF